MNFKSQVISHMNKEHLNKRPFKCDLCNDRFFFNHQRVDHKKYKHPTSEDYKFKCTHCDKVLTSEKLLRYHEKSHQEHPCALCKKKFITTFQLKRHIKRKHLNEGYTLRCNFCGRRFTIEEELKNHIGLHHKKIVKCDFKGCKEMFGYQSQMRVHYKFNHKDK